VAIVYITHRLDEVTEIADRVQVLRDGSTALLADVADVNRRDMIQAMIGRRVGDISRPAPAQHEIGTEPALRWVGASAERAFDDVSLEVRPGEVVALYGKLGSGASEVAESAYGLRNLKAGRLEMDGELVTLGSPVSAIRKGVGFLPAERKAGGALMVRSVAENVAVASWPVLARLGIIRDDSEAKAYRRWHDRLSIRSRNDPKQAMATLSGGNQQKVLLSRWLERRSRALLLIEPTRGVDVGARGDIYAALRELAATGMAILVVTSDYEEVFQVADRASVMAKGRLVAELRGDQITTTRLLEAAGG
jgi:ribose transport system ATP-binding protein